MSRALPRQPDFNSLKNQAKQLRKLYLSGDKTAQNQVRTYYPSPGAFASLRDAQLTVARSYGFDGWSALKAAVEKINAELKGNRSQKLSEMNIAQKADFFLDLACVQYNGKDQGENIREPQDYSSVSLS